jgi:hypothetical protein
MMSDFEKRFYAAVCEFIDGRNDGRYGSGGKTIEAQEVTSVEQDTVSSGYCETCWYEEIVLEISYIEKGTGRSRLYTYYGNMASLISELP